MKNEEHFTDYDKEKSFSKGRHFNPGWLSQYPCLAFHRGKKAAFCDLCSLLKPKDKSPFVYSQTASGFTNWKKATERMGEHALSQVHRQAVEEKRRLDCAPDQADVRMMAEKHGKQEQMQRFHGLISHLHTLKTLLRQGVAIRGNDDASSNIYQFNLDKARTDEDLRIFMNTKSYFGHDILSEQEQMLVLAARRNVLREVIDNGLFSIIVDEASDISTLEHMSVTLRTCSKNYEVKEYFIGIAECDNGISAESLFILIKDILARCGLQPRSLIACAFDGASSMVKLGRLLNEYTMGQSIYFHCLAHCNDLVIKDVI